MKYHSRLAEEYIPKVGDKVHMTSMARTDANGKVVGVTWAEVRKV